MGRTGKDNNGVYQFSIARIEKITDGEMEVPPSMGVATAINFQPTGEGRTAITGDFVPGGSRSQSGDSCFTRKRHCRDRASQSHADGIAPVVLHALLG